MRSGPRGDEPRHPEPGEPRHPEPPESAADADQRLRERLEQRFQTRFDEPIARVTAITQDTLALFPTRVWRRFLAGNGFLLSSGMSYQALFAVFAAVYIVFAVGGIWLAGSPETVQALIDLINTYIPGLIGEDGVIKPSDLARITDSTTSVLTITGIAALGVLIWTAIGWITYSRMAVRAIFGVPKDRRSYVLLKARDLLVALVLGAALFVAAVLSVVSTAALEWLDSLFGTGLSDTASVLARVGGLAVVFVIDVIALMVLFRFLADAQLTIRRMRGGAVLGGVGLLALQALGGTLLGGATRNPLLSTFVVFIAMLLWFRLTSIVTLVAASWIAVATEDRGESLYVPTAAERAAREREALVLAAEVRLRDAREALANAPWWRRPGLRWRRDAAQAELDHLHSAPRDYS